MNSTLNRNEEFTNKLERCRFWPDCRNEDVCPFYHPSKPCTAFPNCWYRDKCLFIHPSCKFGMKCSKINCIYAHYKTSPNIGYLFSMFLLKVYFFYIEIYKPHVLQLH